MHDLFIAYYLNATTLQIDDMNKCLFLLETLQEKCFHNTNKTHALYGEIAIRSKMLLDFFLVSSLLII